MRFETSQHLRMGQQMKLAPRMIQSMEILQMSQAELEARVQQELESNPTLEVAEAAGEPGAEAGGDASLDGEVGAVTDARDGGREVSDDAPLQLSGESDAAEFNRLEAYEASNPDAVENEYAQDLTRADVRDYRDDVPDRRGARSDEFDAKAQAIAAAPARGVSLHDHLRGQWALCDVAPELRPLGEAIIGHLEEDGYLRTPLETIAAAQGVPVAQVERALGAVQVLLEPAGVGARTPAECLRLQLDALEDSEDHGWPAGAFAAARRIVEHHLDDVSHNRLPRIAEKTGLSIEEVKESLALLRRLSLAPARRLTDDAAAPIIPDAIVEYDEVQDRYIAYLNDARLPNLRINQEYARLARDRATDKRDREFVRTNLSNAQWLLDAIGQRRHTLLRVVRAVVDAQREFFDQGMQALRPLPMTALAEQLGIHVATVSRAVADKYIATPRGVLPLRKFFSGGVTTDSGDGVAWDAIKEALRAVIDGEDRQKPFSDEQLVGELKKRGIEIARRTIAKYREQLGIQPARLRRAF
jgi:RNA polymerase sigma-54 factor